MHSRILGFRFPLGLCLLSLLFFTAVARGQDDSDCMMCHEDVELSKTRGGQTISLHVDHDSYSQSIHGQAEVACVDCHADLEGSDFPHAEKLERVDCAMCHDDVQEQYMTSLHGRALQRGNTQAPDCAGCHGRHEIQPADELSVESCGSCHRTISSEYMRSLHGEAVTRGEHLAPECWDCHGAHDILPQTDDKSRVTRFNIPFMCGRCHKEGTEVSETYAIPQDSILTHYSLSIHGEGLYKRGLTISAVCSDCHTPHSVLPHTDPRSSIYRDNVPGMCQQCHGRIEEVHTKFIRGELWEKEPNKVPVCIECHEPHEARRVFYDQGMSDQECMECHGRQDLVAGHGGDTLSLYVDPALMAGSAHHNNTCVQCHTGATPSLERACATVGAKVDCSICHADQVTVYNGSIHGSLHARGDPDAPDCSRCHGTHDILLHQNPASPTYVRNVPNLCGECHAESGIAGTRYEGDVEKMYENFQLSVHGRALSEAGLIVSAMCTDCHTTHDERPQADPLSSINEKNIANTCATCHQGILETFQTSIHFTGEAQEGAPLPKCDDCHSSHGIVRTDAVGFMREITTTCGRCHKDVSESYSDTFHGKVVKLGYTETAKCHDCHGAHDILPPTDPASHLSRDNIVETCGNCHPGSHRQFAGYLTHATHHDRTKYPFIYWTWLFMTSLLVGTFIFFGIHTLLWLPRSFQAMRHMKALRTKSAGREVRRFTGLQRSLHILVIVSFLGLAVTGMTLKFSYLDWARWISHILGGFHSTGLIHRICALITFFYFGRHIIDLAYRKRQAGVSWREYLTSPNTMLPTRRDGREFLQTLRWFIGMGPRPDYGRWTYWEKFDYFAVFWGVGMIGFSGLILWFPEIFTRVLPGWFVNVATIIHSDEALLATGFIFTVHFFNTHFRPDRFPMDPVIFTGRVSLEEFKEDRPREYQELLASGELEKRLVPPMNANMVKALKVFGYTALTIGLSLIILIIWAELFEYR